MTICPPCQDREGNPDDPAHLCARHRRQLDAMAIRQVPPVVTQDDGELAFEFDGLGHFVQTELVFDAR